MIFLALLCWLPLSILLAFTVGAVIGKHPPT